MSPLFREPFRRLTEAGLPALVLDGEIAVPDERSVTYLDALSEAIAASRPERLSQFRASPPPRPRTNDAVRSRTAVTEATGQVVPNRSAAAFP
jgi:hypothetical protein